MATMSGRGVITSRTRVSRKSTIERSSSRSGSGGVTAVWPPSAVVLASPSAAVTALPASPLAAAGAGGRPTRRSARVTGRSTRSTAWNAGSVDASTASGSRRMSTSGIRCSHTSANTAMAAISIANE
jgi:hypothetical protein